MKADGKINKRSIGARWRSFFPPQLCAPNKRKPIRGKPTDTKVPDSLKTTTRNKGLRRWEILRPSHFKPQHSSKRRRNKVNNCCRKVMRKQVESLCQATFNGANMTQVRWQFMAIVADRVHHWHVWVAFVHRWKVSEASEKLAANSNKAHLHTLYWFLHDWICPAKIDANLRRPV